MVLSIKRRSLAESALCRASCSLILSSTTSWYKA
ncbi:Uncharacterised protein [Vibrio cholerae]|nr:Uncharacterised protein [Vibrio cholerae]